ncbi:MAG: carboxypeptidase-like regulatory domain-containing protein [Bacteroidetes bacterium]|nr:carboxypeptidase-like regulatory domain-containing protein [Bacteroidota bacterium]
MNKIYTFSFTVLLVVFSVFTNVFAQSSVGKLAGKIVDSETREPLIGANIILMGTDLGAAADINGEYFVLNIVPGPYDVKVSYVGYGEKLITEVRIVGGITFELNVELNAGFELQEIVVSDKKLFEENATNTVRIFDSDQINQLPVRGVEQLASLQAGVVIAEGSGGAGGNATINVRGGRGGEVIFIVDGVVQNDLLFGQNFSQISNASIEQLAFQVGGFEAKFGQSQSGVISITTKSGSQNYSAFIDVQSSTFTDDYGYNLYTANFGGPIIPGGKDHTFFLSAERGWFLDGDPSAIGIDFPSIGESSSIRPGNSESLWRYSAKTYHNLGNQFTVRLGANINTRDFRNFVYVYAKANSDHNPRRERDNLSFNAKLSQNLGSSTFWDVTFGYKGFNEEQGDGVFFNDLEAYGDTLTNLLMPVQGDDATLRQDDIGIFADPGRLNNFYRKIDNQTISGDFSFTSQVDNHLFELGGGGSFHNMRYYSMAPMRLAIRNRDFIDANGDTVLAFSRQRRYEDRRPTRYGYDVFGEKTDASFFGIFGTSEGDFPAANPILAYAYVQDRFELEDLVLNFGVRFDYFDTKARIFSNTELPFAGGTDPNAFDDGDFIRKGSETYVSPRIGLGFPVTSSTVFHAQYGKFISQPRLLDAFLFESRTFLIISTDNFQFNDGEINSETTTQYEVGFRQMFGDNAAALNITAFYKNTEGLANTQARFFFREEGGQRFIIFGVTNADFGTVKGLALTLDIPRLKYFSLSVNYTFSQSEGTGSSTSSSFVAAFRNIDGEIPKVIAPLDFDQRHTGVVNMNIFIPEGELGIFELISANFLFTFNSGRPYTPLETQNLLENSTNFGDTKGFVNSRFAPGSFRIDLKLEKSFKIGNTFITPYVWVENLLDAENVVDVWRSTGNAFSTDYLLTDVGKKLVEQNGPDWESDYKSLERNPSNFGIPRLIRLGVQVNFSKF